MGLQIFYIFSPPCIQPGGARAGAVDDVLITRGAVTSELRYSHVSDDNQAMRPLLVALSL